MYKTIIIIVILISNLLAQKTFDQKILEAREKVFPALVHIQPIKEVFTSGEKRHVQVTGSGVIISKEGLVVTNNHVAEQARFVNCTLSSKHEVEAEVVGLDPWTDLAVLKLDLEKAGLKKVPYAEFGDSDKLEVGRIVMALGSPLGLSRSLSLGVISSIERYFDDVGEMVSPFNLWIQTDAAINPGNSGGPLIDLNGKIIGINARAMIFGENLGFAIPSNTVKYVIEQIKKYGEVERSYIGVDWQEIKEYRLYKNQPDLEGVLIASVEPNSPAEKAGLKPGDLITKINQKKVSALYKEELPKIRLLISNLPIDSKITFEALTKDGNKEITLVTQKQGKFSGNEFVCDEWGLSVKEITPRIVKNFQLDSDKGVLISSLRRGGKADEARVRRGYVLVSVNGQEIQDLEDFKEKYKTYSEEKNESYLLFLQFAKRNWFALIEGDSK
ncbi:MAG: trypsin-like peptidase domain-containing protein [Calditrichaceae bacterium]|nr:trypsin-like peptidase domain-containing protein [Calditrichaceae bacterium]